MKRYFLILLVITIQLQLVLENLQASINPSDVDANVLVIAFAGVGVTDIDIKNNASANARTTSTTGVWRAAMAAPSIFETYAKDISATYLLFQHLSPGLDGSNDRRDPKTGQVMRDELTGEILKTDDEFARAQKYIRAFMANPRIENSKKELILINFSWGAYNCELISKWFFKKYQKLPFAIIGFEAIGKMTFSFFSPFYFSATEMGQARFNHNYYSSGGVTLRDQYKSFLHGQSMEKQMVDMDLSQPGTRYHEMYKELFVRDPELNTSHSAVGIIAEFIGKDILKESAILLQKELSDIEFFK